MGDKKIYIVAKIFDQQGCLAYLCKTPNEARCLPGTLEALRADGGLIVHRLQNSVGNIADLSVCNSPQEVYVVLKAGFFAKNSNSCGKA